MRFQGRAKSLITSITEKWSDARLVERHDRNLRFQLGSTDGVQLATVFTFIEEQRAVLVRFPLPNSQRRTHSFRPCNCEM
jgi:hypothetical protein